MLYAALLPGTQRTLQIPPSRNRITLRCQNDRLYHQTELGREHSVLQYVTLMLDVYQVAHGVGRCVKNVSCFPSGLSESQ